MGEAPRIRIPARERSRRSQAERTAETRARIMRAVVECIDELGFPRTTASEIARRAGVTWGAVQHHFGDKDGILAAVLEDSFNRFAARVGDVPDEAAGIEKRVSLFVDRAWEHFASPHYRSTFEILLSHVPEEAADEPAWQAEMFRAWNGIWQHLFGDVGLSRRRLAVVQHYTLALLSGLAALRVLEGEAARLREAELSLLKETLVRELGRGDGS
jgi:AcrR family transcriptional regulator